MTPNEDGMKGQHWKLLLDIVGVAQAQPSGGKEVGEDTAGNECDTFYSYFLAWTCNTHLNPDKMCISMQTL